MPEGEEAVVEQQIVNILDPVFQEEIELTLTKAQALFIFRILEANIAPRGLQMVEFAYDLMKRFDIVQTFMTDSVPAPETTVTVETAEIFEEKSEMVVPAPAGTGHVMPNNIGNTVNEE
jgi:hypothetical protein